MQCATLEPLKKTDPLKHLLFLSGKESWILAEALNALYDSNKRRKNIKKLIDQLEDMPIFSLKE